MSSEKKYFVTGGTGFIGTHLLGLLVEQGARVRVLSRRENPPPPPGMTAEQDALHKEQVEIVQGDIADKDAIRRGMEGCSHVFHMAAYAKNWAPDVATFTKLNVDAVRDVLDCARELGVQRTVWTSTIMTMGPTEPGVVADESTPRYIPEHWTEYGRTKAEAEELVVQRVSEGQEVVMVNPTRVYGPGRLSEGNTLAKLIDDYDLGKIHVLPNLGRNVGNYVFVDDVAKGHVLAMEHGRPGERYILGESNLSLKDFFRAIGRVSGRPHWQIPIGPVVPHLVARFQEFRARRFGVYPQITPAWVSTFFHEWAFSCDKAKRELGYDPTPFHEGLRRTLLWLRSLRESGGEEVPRGGHVRRENAKRRGFGLQRAARAARRKKKNP